jgi:hypothetical protein
MLVIDSSSRAANHMPLRRSNQAMEALPRTHLLRCEIRSGGGSYDCGASRVSGLLLKLFKTGDDTGCVAVYIKMARSVINSHNVKTS